MEVRVVEATADAAPYVVEVGGDVDMATVVDLEAPVIDAIRAGRHRVILDLTHCVFMDSTGLRFLVRAHHAVEESTNGDGRNSLAVVARGHVAGLLELTAIDKVLAVVPSRAEAEALLTG